MSDSDIDSDNIATLEFGVVLQGMEIPGLPPGAGDRRVTAVVNIPADNIEFANELWYKTLKILLSSENMREYARSAGVDLQ